MASPAAERMTLDAFLDFDDGTDTRYELIDGELVAMAPAAPAHALMSTNIGSAVKARLAPPCIVLGGAGVARPDRPYRCFVPDLLVTCKPLPRGSRYVEEPWLIVEVLSPSTSKHDRAVKLDGYRDTPSVREILFVWTTERRVQRWQRDDPRWIVQDFIGDADVALEVLESPLSLAAIYENVELEPEPLETPPAEA